MRGGIVRYGKENKMARLINADALIAKAYDEAQGMTEPLKSDFPVYVDWLVGKMPTESEEIIYCPACKYGEGHYPNVKCTKYYSMGGPDDYCSRAERKEATWEKKDLGGVEYTGVCSNCGYGSFWSEVKNYILCPNCGARMTERRQDDT